MMAVRDAARAGVGRLRLPSDSTVSGRRRTAIVSALTMERCADRDPEPRVPSRRPLDKELLLTMPDELLLAIEKGFGIRFNVGEVEGAGNVGELADLIAKRPNAR